jgi:hypothetical protein
MHEGQARPHLFRQLADRVTDFWHRSLAPSFRVFRSSFSSFRLVALCAPFLVASGMTAAAGGCMSQTERITSAPSDEHSKGIEQSGFVDPKPARVLEAKKLLAPGDAPVVLIVLDGARWQEIFGGADAAMGASRGFDTAKLAGGARLLPNLHALIDRGVAIGAPGHGAPIRASGPSYISLPGYMEIFSGASTRCPNNACAPTRDKTIVDEIRETAHTSEEVAVVSSWPTIERAAALDPQKIVMSAGSHHSFNAAALRFDAPSSQLFWIGEEAVAWPGEGDYRPDALTAEIALKYLAKRKPRFLFIGLGDMDEYAHKNDYRDYILSLEYADKVIGDVVTTLDAMGERGKKTTIIVTADHGRADNFRSHGPSAPESSRVWLVAAGGEVPARGVVDAAKEHRLADIAPTLRALVGLPAPVTKAGRSAGEPMVEVLPDGHVAASEPTASPL